MTQNIKNVLVTGANGQLGNELRKLASTCATLHFVFTDIKELDITCPEAITRMIEDEKIDMVINCAAYTAVDKAESDPELAHKLNAEAPGYLAKAISARGGEMIHVSTDYVFSGTNHTPYTEDLPTDPQSVYGSTKLEGEKKVQEACERSVIVRTAWLYSCYGNNFVKTMIRLGRERKELNVIFDQIGTPTYARDLAQAILAIATADERHYGIFHFTDEGATSWYDFTKVIHQMAGITTCQVHPIRTDQYPTPAQRPAYSLLDKTKIKTTYNIQIPYWQDALRDCIDLLIKEEKEG